jgi:uncharacterized protein (DUF302 family)
MKNKRRLFLQQIAGYFLFINYPAKQTTMNTQGIITRTSPYDVKETMDRLVVFLEKNGATIYTRINQQCEVQNSGRTILPIEFLLFGNPANGGAIIASDPLAALDLPLKILAWQGPDKIVKVSFNDPFYIQKRYSLSDKLAAPLHLAPLIEKALA